MVETRSMTLRYKCSLKHCDYDRQQTLTFPVTKRREAKEKAEYAFRHDKQSLEHVALGHPPIVVEEKVWAL